MKKKNYEKNKDQNQLKKSLVEAKDIFRENYQGLVIMHMVIVEKENNILINDTIKGDYLFLEINFISIPYQFTYNFDRLLENHQIKIKRYMSGSYVKSFIDDQTTELFLMAIKLNEGFNKNEVQLVSKYKENKGFFEKFFQLFS